MLKRKVSALLVGLLASSTAWAHFPIMSCWYESQQVVCEAGYSDGSSAVDYVINLFDYDDNLIAKSVTDNRSRVQFVKPDGEFYIVFDAGHESPVEVDVVELKHK